MPETTCRVAGATSAVQVTGNPRRTNRPLTALALRRTHDGDERAAGSNQARGPLLDVAADDIEHQIDAADVFQRVVAEVDELHRAKVERPLTVGSASGADDVRAELTRELRHHRPDR